jgi:hypothetical protein
MPFRRSSIMAAASTGWHGSAFRVGGVDVLHRRGVADAEQARAVDRIAGVAGLVEDAVLADLSRPT